MFISDCCNSSGWLTRMKINIYNVKAIKNSKGTLKLNAKNIKALKLEECPK